MTITNKAEGAKLTLSICGRLDTTTSPALEAEISKTIDGIDELTLDFSQLEYISSAGLRVLLATQKRMKGKGAFVLENVSPEVFEVFEITGFSDILTIR